MVFPRRFLPPMSLLCSFEAAARRQSFTAAAEELNLTQSAVSRQIRMLEETLGAQLFHRERRTVRLTLAGEAYAREVGDALTRVATATLGFRANPSGGSLNLAILPTFGARWLVPRLPSFTIANPNVSLNLISRLAPFDFRLENVDAAIHFGPPEWPGATLDLIMGETVVPVCSPDLLARSDIRRADDLLGLSLLHLVSRPDAWERWFVAVGVAHPPLHGMLFDQFNVVAAAAAAGLGVALLPEFLIMRELAQGELVRAIEAPFQPGDRYYLAWPPERASHPPLQVFRRWLAAEADERTSPSLNREADPSPSDDAPRSRPRSRRRRGEPRSGV